MRLLLLKAKMLKAAVDEYHKLKIARVARRRCWNVVPKIGNQEAASLRSRDKHRVVGHSVLHCGAMWLCMVWMGGSAGTDSASCKLQHCEDHLV
jgi:hypothetical protein